MFAKYVQIDYYMKDLASATQECVSFHAIKDSSNSLGQEQIAAASANKATSVTYFDLTQGPPKLNELSFSIQTLAPAQRNWNLRKCPAAASDVVLNTDNEKVVSGIFINDIFGQNALLLLIDSNREDYYTGITSLVIAFVFCIVVCIVMAVLILIFLECFVLFPLIGLSKQILRIEKSQDTSIRLKSSPLTSKQDEMGRMTVQVNNMLQSIDTAKKKQLEEEHRLQGFLQRIALEEEKNRNIMNTIPDFVVIVSQSDGTIVFTNQTVQDTLQYSELDLHNVRIDKFLDSKLFSEYTPLDSLLKIRDKIV